MSTDDRMLWARVDDYLTATLLPHDAALDAALVASHAAGLPAIAVSATQGRMLEVFARMLNARRILEIGTLGGYSTLWLARGLAADGHLVTLESDARHAQVAQENFARAGMAARITLRLGLAADTLAALQRDGTGPFDLVFIDADKASLREYVQAGLALSRPGTLILADNVIRDGAVIDATNSDASVQGVRRMNDYVAQEPRLAATALQTVGAKGYDGFALMVVTR
ncbi:MAG: O-methyltransferase [Candidatus Eisenbacteria bacterium]